MKRLLFIFLIFPSLTFAQEIMIEGLVDCGNWLTARQAKTSPYLEHYLIGLINGLALGRNMEIWNANGVKVSREQLFFWMDKYCQKNPLSYVVTGSLEFSDERTNHRFKKKLGE